MKRVKQNIYSHCISAFGGIGIYKWDLIKDLSYVVVFNADYKIKVLCEHVPFNNGILDQYYCNYIYRSYSQLWKIFSKKFYKNINDRKVI